MRRANTRVCWIFTIGGSGGEHGSLLQPHSLEKILGRAGLGGDGDARTLLKGLRRAIAEYASLGIDEFVLSGYPHLEEAYWFGEGVLPELGRLGLVKEAA